MKRHVEFITLRKFRFVIDGLFFERCEFLVLNKSQLWK